jgi:predicted HicB family RNase H-like nuclease
MPQYWQGNHMNTLKHKDFIGVFNYIEEEEIMFGKIEGITDLVTFEGISIEEIKKSFIEAVEDYLELCKEAGKEPYKSFKGSFNVRIAPELHRLAFIKAKQKKENLNSFVEHAIEQAVKKF